MEEFRSCYHRHCKDSGQEPLCGVLGVSTDEPSELSRTLDLSCTPISPEASVPLSRAIVEAGGAIGELDLGDCVLGDAGTAVVCDALQKNESVARLNLRGNVIKMTGAKAIGELLRANRTLTSLCLEWNSGGLFESGIASIAEGLRANTALVELDLRNNRIGPSSGAILARAIAENCSLRAIDLRWNNIGLTGGRALVDALRTNVTIQVIEIAGNDVPSDVAMAIESGTARNRGSAGSSTSLGNSKPRADSGALRLRLQETAASVSELQLRCSEEARASRESLGRVKELEETLSAAREQAAASIADMGKALEASRARERESADATQRCQVMTGELEAAREELARFREEAARREKSDRAQVSTIHKKLAVIVAESQKARERNAKLEADARVLEREYEARVATDEARVKAAESARDAAAQEARDLSKELEAQRQRAERDVAVLRAKLAEAEGRGNADALRMSGQVSELQSRVAQITASAEATAKDHERHAAAEREARATAERRASELEAKLAKAEASAAASAAEAQRVQSENSRLARDVEKLAAAHAKELEQQQRRHEEAVAAMKAKYEEKTRALEARLQEKERDAARLAETAAAKQAEEISRQKAESERRASQLESALTSAIKLSFTEFRGTRS